MTGNALIRPYAAAGASLALIPVSFTATPDGATHFTTTATLSGPLGDGRIENARMRSEEHTSELQSLMRISYAVFCLKKKKQNRKRLPEPYKTIPTRDYTKRTIPE